MAVLHSGSALMTAAIAGGKFGLLDWIVLLGYFIGITLFGLWLARRIKSSGDYFLGDRKLPWWIMVGQAFGTGTNAENPVAQAGSTFNAGFATIWFQWKNMLITPLYWLTAPWYRRSQRTTIGEIIEDRYSRNLGLVYSLFAIAFFVFNQGAMLKGAAKVISAATADAVTPNAIIISMTIAFVIYSYFGGLIAAAYTDFIQGFMIIVLSFMLIPSGLRAVGGFAGMRESLPEDFFQLYSEASGLDAFTIAMLTLNGIIGVSAMPHMVSMAATGKSERAGRIGTTYGAMVKRFCTVGWALTGLIVAAMIVQSGEKLGDPEHAFGYASLHLLWPGMTGLLVACVLAANMSTCSNFMVNSGALFTRNIYREYFDPHADDRRLLRAGRFSGLAFTGLSIFFALKVQHVLDAFLFTETIAALMGVMFVGGFLWKRANRWGAWAATIGAFVSYYACNYLMSCKPADGSAKFSRLGDAVRELSQAMSGNTAADFLHTGKVMLVYKWTPGPFGIAMLIGGLLLLIVSLLTRAEDPQRIAAFFDRQKRSSDHEDGLTATGRPAAEEGKDLILLDLPGWLTAERWRHFGRRYREDLIGFGLAWVSVAVMVLLAWGLMQLR